MTDILRTIDLSKRFRNTMALDHLNMTVPEHSVYGLVGPNGAGKTTTIKILMNILQASDGTAEIFGRDSRKLSPHDFTQIGYVSENQEMPEWMTVEYFMNYLKPFYPNWDSARAAELLHQFDLPLDRKIRNLSHGMRMKAALASSLAYRPPLIILDEPFTGLDALVRDEFIAGVLECAEDATILISSHDLAEIETFASHIGYLDNGRLQFSEEMTSLTERFREIEITLANPVETSAAWPAAWLNREQSTTVVRFVDSHFDQTRTMAEVQGVFGAVQQINVSAMPLRAIFVTLAKAGRKAA
ncbi:MAG TPA: ABC transporter ATP-binding protein [Candidatus Acidoferrales bacterium]